VVVKRMLNGQLKYRMGLLGGVYNSVALGGVALATLLYSLCMHSVINRRVGNNQPSTLISCLLIGICLPTAM
jgi:hypothetical protein